MKRLMLLALVSSIHQVHAMALFTSLQKLFTDCQTKIDEERNLLQSDWHIHAQVMIDEHLKKPSAFVDPAFHIKMDAAGTITKKLFYLSCYGSKQDVFQAMLTKGIANNDLSKAEIIQCCVEELAEYAAMTLESDILRATHASTCLNQISALLKSIDPDQAVAILEPMNAFLPHPPTSLCDSVLGTPIKENTNLQTGVKNN